MLSFPDQGRTGKMSILVSGRQHPVKQMHLAASKLCAVQVAGENPSVLVWSLVYPFEWDSYKQVQPNGDNFLQNFRDYTAHLQNFQALC